MTLYEIDKSIEQLVNAVNPETGELLVIMTRSTL